MRVTPRTAARLVPVLAIVALVVAAVSVASYVLGHQRTAWPAWVPSAGDQGFEVRAVVPSLEGVVPGQGQPVLVAGLSVGTIVGAEPADGAALVTMRIDGASGVVVRRDARVQLRPRTPLRDMAIALDPGTPGAPRLREGATLPLAAATAEVTLDQVLATLDHDARQALVLLVHGLGAGLGGHGPAAAAALRELRPLSIGAERITAALAARRAELRRVVRHLRLVLETGGRNTADLATFAVSAARVLETVAGEDAALDATLRRLPGVLDGAHGVSTTGRRLAEELREAATGLLPGARRLDPALRVTTRLLTQTQRPLRSRLRPFTRQVRTTVRDGRRTVAALAPLLTAARSGVHSVVRLANALAAARPGRRSPLFAAAWLAHNLNSALSVTDGVGPLARAMLTISCDSTAAVTAAASVNRSLKVLLGLLRQPSAEEC